MEDKIPVIQVLDDMYSDKGPVSWAARDYYYQNYATADEQKSMDREDRVNFIVAMAIISFIPIGIVLAAIFR